MHANLWSIDRQVTLMRKVSKKVVMPALQGSMLCLALLMVACDGREGSAVVAPTRATPQPVYPITAPSFAGHAEFKLQLVVRPARPVESARCTDYAECR